jgi:XisH protein
MARDKFHQEVKNALANDGWKVTHDPLYLKVGRIPVHIDLGAEKIIGAERDGEQIAVEIKTFGIASFITALYEAVGKYIVYREALLLRKSERILYLAIPNNVYEAFGEEEIVTSVFEKYDFKILLYEPTTGTIVSWIK